MHVLIVGNGIAGVTAARHVRKRDPRAAVTVVSDESDHPWARTALMYLYMGQLTFAHTKLYEDRFWAENRIALRRARVVRLDAGARRAHLASGEPIGYDRLLIATGSRWRTLPVPGADAPNVTGLVSLQDLERMERGTVGARRAVVVGGGLIGVEAAEMLRTRGIGVTLLVRERGYQDRVLPPEAAAMVGAEIRRHGVDLRLATEAARIEVGPSGRAAAVVTAAGERVPCDFVALTVGVEPNVSWLAGSGVEVGRGVLVDEALRTNVEGVFAAGDCAELRTPAPGRRATEPLWYTARTQGLVAAHGLAGEPRPYRPGVFYNSAKFFDLEYQVYGRIEPVPRAGEAGLVAQSPDGRRAIRIQYAEGEAGRPGPVVGFNLMGVRFRHDVCAGWIAAGTPLPEVVQRLGHAAFDPEFTRPLEGRVAGVLAARYPGLALARTERRGWRRWMAVNTLTGRDTLPGRPLP